MLSDTCIDAYRTFQVCEDCQFGLNFTIIVLIKYIRYVDEIYFNCHYGLKDAVILLLRNYNNYIGLIIADDYIVTDRA